MSEGASLLAEVYSVDISILFLNTKFFFHLRLKKKDFKVIVPDLVNSSSPPHLSTSPPPPLPTPPLPHLPTSPPPHLPTSPPPHLPTSPPPHLNYGLVPFRLGLIFILSGISLVYSETHHDRVYCNKSRVIKPNKIRESGIIFVFY